MSTLGRKSEEIEEADLHEFDSLLYLRGIPPEVAAKFTNLEESQLKRLAWSATRWSPGTLEKQIVLQLRAKYWTDFSKPRGRGLSHSGDNTEGGVGTLPETYASGMGGK